MEKFHHYSDLVRDWIWIDQKKDHDNNDDSHKIACKSQIFHRHESAMKSHFSHNIEISFSPCLTICFDGNVKFASQTRLPQKSATSNRFWCRWKKELDFANGIRFVSWHVNRANYFPREGVFSNSFISRKRSEHVNQFVLVGWCAIDMRVKIANHSEYIHRFNLSWQYETCFYSNFRHIDHINHHEP